MKKSIYPVEVASIIEQLKTQAEIYTKSGYEIGNICCQIAISALVVITTKNNPPTRWQSRGGYK